MAVKRGDGAQAVPLDEFEILSPFPDDDQLLAVNEALEKFRGHELRGGRGGARHRRAHGQAMVGLRPGLAFGRVAQRHRLSVGFLHAGLDLSQRTLRGHWKNRVTVLGLWMRPPTLRPDGRIGLRISGAAGRAVQVQTSTNLVNWDNWQSVVLGENGTELVDEPSAAPMRYFRAAEVPEH